jgi:hypothetical protein
MCRVITRDGSSVDAAERRNDRGSIAAPAAYLGPVPATCPDDGFVTLTVEVGSDVVPVT